MNAEGSQIGSQPSLSGDLNVIPGRELPDVIPPSSPFVLPSLDEKEPASDAPMVPASAAAASSAAAIDPASDVSMDISLPPIPPPVKIEIEIDGPGGFDKIPSGDAKLQLNLNGNIGPASWDKLAKLIASNRLDRLTMYRDWKIDPTTKRYREFDRFIPPPSLSVAARLPRPSPNISLAFGYNVHEPMAYAVLASIAPAVRTLRWDHNFETPVPLDYKPHGFESDWADLFRNTPNVCICIHPNTAHVDSPFLMLEPCAHRAMRIECHRGTYWLGTCLNAYIVRNMTLMSRDGVNHGGSLVTLELIDVPRTAIAAIPTTTCRLRYFLWNESESSRDESDRKDRSDIVKVANWISDSETIEWASSNLWTIADFIGSYMPPGTPEVLGAYARLNPTEWRVSRCARTLIGLVLSGDRFTDEQEAHSIYVLFGGRDKCLFQPSAKSWNSDFLPSSEGVYSAFVDQMEKYDGGYYKRTQEERTNHTYYITRSGQEQVETNAIRRLRTGVDDVSKAGKLVKEAMFEIDPLRGSGIIRSVSQSAWRLSEVEYGGYICLPITHALATVPTLRRVQFTGDYVYTKVGKRDAASLGIRKEQYVADNLWKPKVPLQVVVMAHLDRESGLMGLLRHLAPYIEELYWDPGLLLAPVWIEFRRLRTLIAFQTPQNKDHFKLLRDCPALTELRIRCVDNSFSREEWLNDIGIKRLTKLHVEFHTSSGDISADAFTVALNGIGYRGELGFALYGATGNGTMVTEAHVASYLNFLGYAHELYIGHLWLSGLSNSIEMDGAEETIGDRVYADLSKEDWPRWQAVTLISATQVNTSLLRAQGTRAYVNELRDARNDRCVGEFARTCALYSRIDEALLAKFVAVIKDGTRLETNLIEFGGKTGEEKLLVAASSNVGKERRKNLSARSTPLGTELTSDLLAIVQRIDVIAIPAPENPGDPIQPAVNHTARAYAELSALWATDPPLIKEMIRKNGKTERDVLRARLNFDTDYKGPNVFTWHKRVYASDGGVRLMQTPGDRDVHSKPFTESLLVLKEQLERDYKETFNCVVVTAIAAGEQMKVIPDDRNLFGVWSTSYDLVLMPNGNRRHIGFCNHTKKRDSKKAVIGCTQGEIATNSKRVKNNTLMIRRPRLVNNWWWGVAAEAGTGPMFVLSFRYALHRWSDPISLNGIFLGKIPAQLMEENPFLAVLDEEGKKQKEGKKNQEEHERVLNEVLPLFRAYITEKKAARTIVPALLATDTVLLIYRDGYYGVYGYVGPGRAQNGLSNYLGMIYMQLRKELSTTLKVPEPVPDDDTAILDGSEPDEPPEEVQRRPPPPAAEESSSDEEGEGEAEEEDSEVDIVSTDGSASLLGTSRWGPPMWGRLHRYASSHTEWTDETTQWLLQFRAGIPCLDPCRVHFDHFWDTYPRTGPVDEWACELHNSVNRKLCKPEYECSRRIQVDSGSTKRNGEGDKAVEIDPPKRDASESDKDSETDDAFITGLTRKPKRRFVDSHSEPELASPELRTIQLALLALFGEHYPTDYQYLMMGLLEPYRMLTHISTMDVKYSDLAISDSGEFAVRHERGRRGFVVVVYRKDGSYSTQSSVLDLVLSEAESRRSPDIRITNDGLRMLYAGVLYTIRPGGKWLRHSQAVSPKDTAFVQTVVHPDTNERIIALSYDGKRIVVEGGAVYEYPRKRQIQSLPPHDFTRSHTHFIPNSNSLCLVDFTVWRFVVMHTSIRGYDITVDVTHGADAFKEDISVDNDHMGILNGCMVFLADNVKSLYRVRYADGKMDRFSLIDHDVNYSITSWPRNSKVRVVRSADPNRLEISYRPDGYLETLTVFEIPNDTEWITGGPKRKAVGKIDRDVDAILDSDELNDSVADTALLALFGSGYPIDMKERLLGWIEPYRLLIQSGSEAHTSSDTRNFLSENGESRWVINDDNDENDDEELIIIEAPGHPKTHLSAKNWRSSYEGTDVVAGRGGIRGISNDGSSALVNLLPANEMAIMTLLPTGKFELSESFSSDLVRHASEIIPSHDLRRVLLVVGYKTKTITLINMNHHDSVLEVKTRKAYSRTCGFVSGTYDIWIETSTGAYNAGRQVEIIRESTGYENPLVIIPPITSHSGISIGSSHLFVMESGGSVMTIDYATLKETEYRFHPKDGFAATSNPTLLCGIDSTEFRVRVQTTRMYYATYKFKLPSDDVIMTGGKREDEDDELGLVVSGRGTFREIPDSEYDHPPELSHLSHEGSVYSVTGSEMTRMDTLGTYEWCHRKLPLSNGRIVRRSDGYHLESREPSTHTPGHSTIRSHRITAAPKRRRETTDTIPEDEMIETSLLAMFGPEYPNDYAYLLRGLLHPIPQLIESSRKLLQERAYSMPVLSVDEQTVANVRGSVISVRKMASAGYVFDLKKVYEKDPFDSTSRVAWISLDGQTVYIDDTRRSGDLFTMFYPSDPKASKMDLSRTEISHLGPIKYLSFSDDGRSLVYHTETRILVVSFEVARAKINNPRQMFIRSNVALGGGNMETNGSEFVPGSVLRIHGLVRNPDPNAGLVLYVTTATTSSVWNVPKSFYTPNEYDDWKDDVLSVATDTHVMILNRDTHMILEVALDTLRLSNTYHLSLSYRFDTYRIERMLWSARDGFRVVLSTPSEIDSTTAFHRVKVLLSVDHSMWLTGGPKVTQNVELENRDDSQVVDIALLALFGPGYSDVCRSQLLGLVTHSPDLVIERVRELPVSGAKSIAVSPDWNSFAYAYGKSVVMVDPPGAKRTYVLSESIAGSEEGDSLVLDHLKRSLENVIDDGIVSFVSNDGLSVVYNATHHILGDGKEDRVLIHISSDIDSGNLRFVPENPADWVSHRLPVVSPDGDMYMHQEGAASVTVSYIEPVASRTYVPLSTTGKIHPCGTYPPAVIYGYGVSGVANNVIVWICDTDSLNRETMRLELPLHFCNTHLCKSWETKLRCTMSANRIFVLNTETLLLWIADHVNRDPFNPAYDLYSLRLPEHMKGSVLKQLLWNDSLGLGLVIRHKFAADKPAASYLLYIGFPGADL